MAVCAQNDDANDVQDVRTFNGCDPMFRTDHHQNLIPQALQGMLKRTWINDVP